MSVTEADLALLADVQEKAVLCEAQMATATGFDLELLDIRCRVLRKTCFRLASALIQAGLL